MKIFAISDLHLSTTGEKPMDVFGGVWTNYVEKIKQDWSDKVSDDDIVLISGDISWAMKLEDAIIDLDEIKDLKGKKVMIRGNHDYWWKSLSKIRSALPSGFFVLQNDAIKIEKTVICGTRGWTCEGSPDFGKEDKKLYLREAERLRLALINAQKVREYGDKLIVMIHFPPFNVRRENSLFTELFESFNVDAVVYGHLHGKDSRADRKLTKNGIDYYLTSCDQVDFKLTEIELGE
ncbi:MAG: metallophosphoesterase [Clostridia bacterium]|nr:metallophosphoesterase [Clostridia bacterium]